MKKSHILLLGSLLVFGGFSFLTRDYFVRIKDLVYSDMMIRMSLRNAPVKEDVVVQPSSLPTSNDNPTYEESVDYTIDYSKYFGILEIPKIGLKRGFYNVDSKYNNVDRNVTMVSGSSMPDQATGKLILMGHSGNAYNSYFVYLYKLEIGDECYITYNGQAYHFVIKNIYNVEKNGMAVVNTNENVFSLVLITCTKDDDRSQTIYIAENVG